MIVFHEGLPGAGKSYEACVYHILLALKAGRNVITNIEGINHDKFAEVSGIPVRFVKEMLLCIYHEDEPDLEVRVKKQWASFLSLTKDDSLVVVDEIQDIHPPGRQKLDTDSAKFITEHRHRGLDIILMGQDRRDCHNLWRRRVQRLITFSKMTYFGMAKKYRWVAYEATTPEKFKKVSSGFREYDKQYFGLYASHVATAKNTDVYADERTSLFKQGAFVFGVPALIVMMFVAYQGFQVLFGRTAEPEANKAYTAKVEPQVQQVKAPTQAKPIDAIKLADAQKKIKEAALQKLYGPPLVESLIEKYTMRLSGVVHSLENDGKIFAQVDFVDRNYQVRDSLTVQALKDLGWKCKLRQSGLHLRKGDLLYVVRPWPIRDRNRFQRASML